MGRRRQSESLQIALNGRRVGWLTRASDGAQRFEYAREWLDWPFAMPISLSLLLAEQVYTGSVVSAFFDNLLPDDEAVRARIAARLGARGSDGFSLLSALGRDCVGALEFLSTDASPQPPETPRGEPLAEQQIAERIRALASVPLGLRGGDETFRLSIAGAQHKTALLFHQGRWMLPQRNTPTTHILKPQIGLVPTALGSVDMSSSVQNEHLCMRLAAALGLPVAETDILQLDDDLLVLSIKRFDRQLDDHGRLLRIPQEDFCQAMGVAPVLKYESDGGPGIQACLELLKSSDQPELDRRCFMRALLVFWLLGATDGHAKNFSLQLRPRGRFGLTPLYDILSTQWQHDLGQIPRKAMRLAMAVGTKRRYRVADILPRHFEQTARKADFSIKDLREVMQDVVDAMPTAAAQIESLANEHIPEAMVTSILNAADRRAELIGTYLKG